MGDWACGGKAGEVAGEEHGDTILEGGPKKL